MRSNLTLLLKFSNNRYFFLQKIVSKVIHKVIAAVFDYFGRPRCLLVNAFLFVKFLGHLEVQSMKIRGQSQFSTLKQIVFFDFKCEWVKDEC